MAKFKKTGDRSVRIICDCGFYVHDLTSDNDGKLSLQTTKVKDEPKPEPKLAPPVRSIFDPVANESGEEENPD